MRQKRKPKQETYKDMLKYRTLVNIGELLANLTAIKDKDPSYYDKLKENGLIINLDSLRSWIEIWSVYDDRR